MIKRFIFTVTNGRSGQATLHKLLKENTVGCVSKFEAPSINVFFPWIFGDLEKSFEGVFWKLMNF